MTRRNKSRAATAKQTRRHNHRRRLSVVAGAALLALASVQISASSASLDDGEKQELARLAKTLRKINATDSWSYDASRFLSAYSSNDMDYMNHLLAEKEMEVEAVKILQTSRRRLMDSVLADGVSDGVGVSGRQLRGLKASKDGRAENERDLRNSNVGVSRTFANERSKAKTVQNGNSRTNDYYYSRPYDGYGSNQYGSSQIQYASNGYYGSRYSSNTYTPDPYPGKAAKAARQYSQSANNYNPINNSYGSNTYASSSNQYYSYYPDPTTTTHTAKSAKTPIHYLQPIQPPLPMVQPPPPQTYLNLGDGYYMYNDRYFFYGTPVMCWYESNANDPPTNNNNNNNMMYNSSRNGQEDADAIQLRRRQPFEYAESRYGHRDLHWSYSPNYFQGGGTYHVHSKSGKGGKGSKQGFMPVAKAAKAGVHWLYPHDSMYNVICLSGLYPPQDDYVDDYQYDEEYLYDDEYTDDVKPTRRPTPNKTKKPTRRPTNPKPTPDDIKTPEPTIEDATPAPTLRCPAGCPDCDPDSPLPCPPPEMKRLCDKGNKDANFIDCYQMCKPSFCCIHDSNSKEYSPSCTNEYENCFLYYPCYIIWWKLSDTIGPATYMRVEQDEPFYNVDFSYLEKDWEEDQPFFQQLFGHHFDGDDAPTDETFENEENW